MKAHASTDMGIPSTRRSMRLDPADHRGCRCVSASPAKDEGSTGASGTEPCSADRRPRATATPTSGDTGTLIVDDIERAVGFTVSPHSLRHQFGAGPPRCLRRRRFALAGPLQPRDHLSRVRLPDAQRRATRPRRDGRDHAPGRPRCVPRVDPGGGPATIAP
jgi:hypothetical protein